jgi:SAM-dependent methyltransferase
MTNPIDAGNSPANNWNKFYQGHRGVSSGRYPTEWVVRTLAGGNYPTLHLDRTQYPGARILDMGCGDGRNLRLLLDLGFEVHAMEITPAIVENLRSLAGELGWPVQLSVGTNASLPYPDQFFDYMLCCSSCYYLGGTTNWPTVLAELARVIKPGGFLVANFPDEDNAVLRNSIRQADGSLLVTDDPHGLRNGTRFMTAKDAEAVAALVSPQFRLVALGHQDDDYYGLRVSGYFVVAQKS